MELDFDNKQESDIAKWFIKTVKKKLQESPRHMFHQGLSSSFTEERLSKFEAITAYEQLVNCSKLRG